MSGFLTGVMSATASHTELAHALWDELADFPLAHAEHSLSYLLERVCKLLGAQNASWIGAVRVSGDFPDDPLFGWRVRVVTHLNSSATLRSVSQQGARDVERGKPDVTTVRNVAGAGTFRVNRLMDLVPPEWFESSYYRSTYLDLGHADALWAGVPVNAEAESYFGVYRGPAAPRFTAGERDAFGYLLRGLKWFHRRQMLSHGLLIADTPLTASEKKVLHGLLTGRTEKQIAALVGRSYNTVHETVGALYRKFGVKNRSALMALWIGAA